MEWFGSKHICSCHLCHMQPGWFVTVHVANVPQSVAGKHTYTYTSSIMSVTQYFVCRLVPEFLISSRCLRPTAS